jgi:hypothetical protein
MRCLDPAQLPAEEPLGADDEEEDAAPASHVCGIRAAAGGGHCGSHEDQGHNPHTQIRT